MQLPANSVQLISGGNVIKHGDETPFTFQLNDESGQPVDLTGATVNIRLANSQVVVLEKQATINDDNTVTFNISSDETTGHGNMRLEFVVTYPNEKTEIFPAQGYQEITITPSLGSLDSGYVAVITIEEFERRINEAVAYANTQGNYAKDQGDYAKQQGDIARDETSTLSQLKDEVVTATDNANQSAINADNAATNANEAGAYANTQGNYAKDQGDYAKQQGDIARDESSNLSQLKEDVVTAIDSANQSATNADNAATNANEQATFANEQGDYAKTQGDYAKQQGDTAKDEASNLSQLKDDVTTATTNANQSAINADNAATNANEQATFANTQGNYAKDQGDYAKAQGDAIQDIFDEGLVASVNGQTGAVVLDADDVGAETPEGAQAKADTAEQNAKTYTDQEIAKIPDPTWDNLQNKPSQFPPISHSHSISEINGLQTELSSKATTQKVEQVESELNAHQTDVATYTGTCAYANNVYTITVNREITNDIFTVKFKAPNEFVEGSTFEISGTTYTPINAYFEKDEVVTVNFDRVQRKAFFKQGGVNDTLPPQVENLVAESGDETIYLSWTISDTDYLDGYLFVYKEGSEPQSINDGIKVTADKTATTLTITGLTNDVAYYIRPFPYNAKKQYQTEYRIAIATPISGIPLSELPVGTKVKDPDTKYYGKPIVFMVLDKNHSGYPSNSVTLLTERIITLKSFDAKESGGNSDRQNYGNNRYLHSNIRQWLNKDTYPWYQSQHSYDRAPSGSYVSSNPYNTEPGFLANFSNELKTKLLPTTLTVVKPGTDGGGTEQVTDKVFLLSRTEVGLGNENSAEGTPFSYFNSDSRRQAHPTAEAVSQSEYTNSNLNTGSPWHWWLRTPYANSAFQARSVYLDGSLYNSYAHYGSRGVRPALNLPSDTLVSDTPDTDGAYIIQF